MSFKEEIINSSNLINQYINKTPVLTSHAINEISGAELYFKCENFQKMGAFKMRGATNKILNLSEDERKNGVVTHSSGNYAQAVALASKKLGIKAYIVMPKNAPQVKKDGVKSYGGIIIECEPTIEAREMTAKAIQDEKKVTFVHPYNDMDVILGNATAGKELLEKHNDLNCIISPIGGGGLISGIILSSISFGNNCSVIGSEPFNVDDAYKSLQEGYIVKNNLGSDTIADGLKTNLGDITFNIIKENVKEIIRVTEEEIIDSMKLIWERMKIIVEPSSAVTLASVLKYKEKFKNKKVGLIISGGNVDLNNLPWIK